MDFFPLGFKLAGGKCLLVGGGAAAVSKARLLDKAGAVLTVVAQKIDPELADMAAQRGGECLRRAYRRGDCEHKRLVIIAEQDQDLLERVSSDAQALNIPVNAVDQPQYSTVIFPALVERSPLSFAIHSDGRAPLLSRYWRHKLEAYIEPRWGAVASFLEELRTRLPGHLQRSDQRLSFWSRLLDSNVLSLVLAGQIKRAHSAAKKLLDDAPQQATGEVWLVGAGPGDPDLLTVAAMRCLQNADVVFYDRLVSEQVLERVRREARRVAVGKSAGCRTIAQQDINKLLVDEARAGRRVLRLKGGDPFIYARGGEELDYVASSGIPFTVVPGISAANGCACYAGIPLTDRRLAHSVRFLSGHTRDGRLDLPWQELLDPEQTLVFYMSNQRLGLLVDGLLTAGRDPQTPSAMIERGTLPQQRVITATLADLVQAVAEAELSAPTLLIVGQVVNLRQNLNWYEGGNDDG